MTLEARVRILRGKWKGRVGRVKALCEDFTVLVHFAEDGDKYDGHWFSRHHVKEIG